MRAGWKRCNGRSRTRVRAAFARANSLQDESCNGEVVKAIVTLGVALGKTVIAEGIETPSELNQLRALGCGYGQGYLLARPLSAERGELLLQSDQRAEPIAETMGPLHAADRPGWSITRH